MNKLENLIVLRSLCNDPLFSEMAKINQSNVNFPLFLNLLYQNNAEENLISYIEKLILTDINPVSSALANEKSPSDFVKRAYINDLNEIFGFVSKLNFADKFNVGSPSSPFDKNFIGEKTFDNLKDFYKSNGIGEFIFNKAFKMSSRGLEKIVNPISVKIDELKNYVNEKKLIEDNILSFLGGLPFSQMLLYGDRGTGKSSTIHAMLDKYSSHGLRLVELALEDIDYLPEIYNRVAKVPLKFLIFIDDLSFESGDARTVKLKTYLEGTFDKGSNNIMIVATSNRRHIINESSSKREDSIHLNDLMQEELSLSDRFGLTVYFSSTDKYEYLSIVHQLAQDQKLKIDKITLENLAERWAISKGDRSPRRARQLIDLIYAAEQKGINVDF